MIDGVARARARADSQGHTHKSGCGRGADAAMATSGEKMAIVQLLLEELSYSEIAV